PHAARAAWGPFSRTAVLGPRSQHHEYLSPAAILFATSRLLVTSCVEVRPSTSCLDTVTFDGGKSIEYQFDLRYARGWCTT
ncbi:hypothetical protein ACWDWV_30285, partial [Streptosporangium sandarakinum]